MSIRQWLEERIPAEFTRASDSELLYALPETHLSCVFGVKSCEPVFKDHWTIFGEIGGLAELRPGMPPGFFESWIAAGTDDDLIVPFDIPVREKSFWSESDLDGLWENAVDVMLPWLYSMRDLEAVRTFFEKVMSTENTESTGQKGPDTDRLVSSFRRGWPGFYMHLGLICLWQKDYQAAHEYLSNYRDFLVSRFKPVANPEFHQQNVDRIEMVREAMDKLPV